MSMTSPYFEYAEQPRRYAFNWRGGAGGVIQSRVAAESRGLGGLGIYDLVESGLDPNTMGFPAFRHTHLHDPTFVPESSLAELGDWPLVRPAGPEPMDPHEGTRIARRSESRGLGDLIEYGGGPASARRKPPVVKRGMGALGDLTDPSTLLGLAAVGAAAYFLFKRSKKR
jgi:hypothetical protein